MQLDLLEWSVPAVVAPNAKAPWSEADIDELTDLYAETGSNVRAIAAKMGRSTTAIWTKASYLGLAVTGNDVKLRRCLGDGCGKMFMSPDKGSVSAAAAR
ncbi:hypothetical protein [Bradyrhizobium sp. Bra64]|uniref:hypothetical protein n=1 Tax=Bradyrhizobium sp. Bra64 TaxID=2926009 RepID=UPI0021195B2D|nr:hypothetical protein [Bradyrhizobium sp. Bra64]